MAHARRMMAMTPERPHPPCRTEPTCSGASSAGVPHVAAAPTPASHDRAGTRTSRAPTLTHRSSGCVKAIDDSPMPTRASPAAPGTAGHHQSASARPSDQRAPERPGDRPRTARARRWQKGQQVQGRRRAVRRVAAGSMNNAEPGPAGGGVRATCSPRPTAAAWSRAAMVASRTMENGAGVDRALHPHAAGVGASATSTAIRRRSARRCRDADGKVGELGLKAGLPGDLRRQREDSGRGRQPTSCSRCSCRFAFIYMVRGVAVQVVDPPHDDHAGAADSACPPACWR